MTNSVDAIDGTASTKCFVGTGGVEEWHVVIHSDASTQNSTAELEARWLVTLRNAGVPPENTVMRRIFCSDIVNQHPCLEKFGSAYPGAFSVIGQAPATGARFVMWSHHIVDPRQQPDTEGSGASFFLRRGSLRHAWNSGLCNPQGADATTQSLNVMEQLNRWLANAGMTLEDDVVRTWWFVRDIDADYHALVDARKSVFSECGLTKDTHYIASTGIAGFHQEATAKLSLDTYAISGLALGQVEYLSAPEHLGPTYRYGVTFERATAVSYADRKHVFISGTASIDPSGEIVHPGDVARQLNRALDNVDALLASAGAGIADLSIMVVYLRDPADGTLIDGMLRQKFPDLPMVMVHAPVCRPGWLIEVEGVACISVDNPDFPDF